MYGHPVTPSKSRLKSRTHLINLAIMALAGAETQFHFIQPLLPVNVYALFSLLLPVTNMVLRENTDRAVGLDAAGVSRSNQIASILLVCFGLAFAAALLFWSPRAAAAIERQCLPIDVWEVPK